MFGVGRGLMVLGAVLVVVGLGVMLWGRLGLPTRLPGDITVRRGPVTIFFPIVTCLVVSVLLSLLLNLFVRRR